MWLDEINEGEKIDKRKDVNTESKKEKDKNKKLWKGMKKKKKEAEEGKRKI